MCDPLTATLVAATAVTAAGQVTSGLQARAQGRYEANVAQQNAGIVRNQQADAIERATADRIKLDRKYSQLEGEQQVALAANGIDANFGSARQTAEDTAMLRGDDANSLYINNNSELRGFDTQIANYKAQGQAARMRGNGALTSAIFGAGSTILGGATQYMAFKDTIPYKTFKKPKAYGIAGSDGIY